jgi:hypothetical protein
MFDAPDDCRALARNQLVDELSQPGREQIRHQLGRPVENERLHTALHLVHVHLHGLRGLDWRV